MDIGEMEKMGKGEKDGEEKREWRVSGFSTGDDGDDDDDDDDDQSKC